MVGFEGVTQSTERLLGTMLIVQGRNGLPKFLLFSTSPDADNKIEQTTTQVIEQQPVAVEPMTAAVTTTRRKRRTKAEMEAARQATVGVAPTPTTPVETKVEVTPAKRGRGRPRKNATPAAEETPIIKKKVTRKDLKVWIPLSQCYGTAVWAGPTGPTNVAFWDVRDSARTKQQEFGVALITKKEHKVEGGTTMERHAMHETGKWWVLLDNPKLSNIKMNA